ncbi:MAG TPA: protein translocase subunit SecD [Deltaproteobacteria bacterium]|nr:MAG: protein-export membrane protein SecD [Deltaproteobacteria bacterium GWA2_45_12]HBF12587.1 protein translocase subunit SecD [Deltaproteobacteria bacterium]
MNSNWKLKSATTLALVVLSIYILIPSFWGISGSGQKSWQKFFPQKILNLGLDLRGGLYLEMDVDLDDSLKNRVDLLIAEMERSFPKETFADLKLSRMDPTNNVRVQIPSSQSSDFINKLKDIFGDIFVKGESVENGFELKLADPYVSRLKEETLKQAEEAVRNRIDRFGVSEASIQRQGDQRLVIELPGLKDPDRVIDIVKKTGLLEFKLVDDAEKTNLDGLVKEAFSQIGVQNDYSKQAVEKINTVLQGKIPEDAEVVFELERDSVSHQITKGIPYLVKKRTDVSGDMLQDARVGISNNEPHVSLNFNNVGSKNFGELTKNHVRERLAILLDGVLVTAPVINEPILTGQAQITLGYGDYKSLLKEAEDLALVLREGALPASLNVVNKTVVGPSLGKDSIKMGLTSIMVAAFVVIVFMMIYYKLGGIIANIALILNIVFLFAIMALFQASLSLPGLAGIVLTMGMAVDANIIIFERMREEQRLGKTARSIIESGYDNAMSAIVDSNITTLISGIVLYQFGTGPIKGFATTLSIGILTTMFTAIVVTRLMYDYFVYGKKIQKVSI